MSDDASLFFMSCKNKIPSDSLFYLKQSLEKASEEQRQKLFFVKIKDPLYGFLFSFILPGLDRIYKGDVILGAIKLVFVIFSYLGFIISFGDKKIGVSVDKIFYPNTSNDPYTRIIDKILFHYFPNTSYDPYTPNASEIFFFFLCVVAVIWVLVDYFLVWKGICKDNLKKIFEVLQ